MLLLVPQVGEVDKGNKGSGDDDHPWLEAACHKLFVANISGLPGGEDKFLDLRRCVFLLQNMTSRCYEI